MAVRNSLAFGVQTFAGSIEGGYINILGSYFRPKTCRLLVQAKEFQNLRDMAVVNPGLTPWSSRICQTDLGLKIKALVNPRLRVLVSKA